MARILVIDDDPQLLRMLGIMLERSGHERILVTSGREGVDHAVRNPPDLAVVDIMMPDMSGHDVVREIRANPATVDVPILILTARTQSVDREAALACGADDFVAKPVTPQELSDKITEMLDRPAKKARGRVITLLSLRGGVGVTTIATNLASALRLQLGPNITLVDLSPNSGHVALQLKIQPQRTWLRLLQQPDLNSDLVRSLLTNHSVGLNLLAAPVAPTMNASLTEGQVAAIASILSDGAEYVIIDAPPTLSAMCVGALRASDLVLLVLTPDVASVQTAAGTLHALVELGISGKRIHLLLNHPASQPGLSKQAVEHGLRRTVTFSVPFDAYQPRALAQGKPLALEDTVSPLPDAVRKIATALVKPI